LFFFFFFCRCCCCCCHCCCCLTAGITNFLPNVPGTTTCRVCCLPRQQLATIRNIAISPDAFEPWPYNVQQMLNWALEPADEDMLQVGGGRGGGSPLG
jgi:hypothetical protein